MKKRVAKKSTANKPASAKALTATRVELGAIVAIGASAGGLASYEKFLRATPNNTGLAYVLISHMAPHQPSLLAELVSKDTAMPVETISDGLQAQADHVYVCPPGKVLEIQDGRFRHVEPEFRAGSRTLIDHFMRSLAEDQGEKAIGIVLSGTGSDGTLGLAAIKAAGGITLAESAESAQHSQMPLSAIRSQVVDAVLPPQDMSSYVLNYTRSVGAAIKLEATADSMQASEHLDAILELLRTRTGHDFRAYKSGTLLRRIARRMGLLHIEKIPAYGNYLRRHPGEVKNLFDDLLIGATRFFREPEAYKALEERVITNLLRDKPKDEPLRVWVPGCATGEEAYSLAILLTECLERAGQHRTLQIFATDIDEKALTFARAAQYPDSISADVVAERLRRWFVHEDDSYRIGKTIRESVVFATQNLINDPPFSKLDLVSCRNLLIYLGPEAQASAIACFNFALRDSGYLWLGISESAGQSTELFTPVSKKWRIYQRTGGPRRGCGLAPIAASAALQPHATGSPGRRPQRAQPATLAELMQAQVLRDFVPACVAINSRFKVLQFLGPTTHYLELPSGAPTQDLLSMVRKGLRAKLRVAVERVLAGKVLVSVNAHMSRDGNRLPVRVIVRPITEGLHDEPVLLVTFLDGPRSEATKESTDGPNELLLNQLEHELQSARQDLQATVAELEVANEELKTLNEEAMLMNEELQSSNEELETSKEELQSLNEELSTVNTQLKAKIEQVQEINNDLSNLLNDTDTATIFLDLECHIRRFTPAAVKLFSLIALDLGRPISDISHRFAVNDLRGVVETVTRTLIRQESEARTIDDRWYIRRVMPYLTVDKRVDGVVVTFSDITALKQLEQALLVSDKRLRMLYDHNPSMYFTLDNKGLILSVNRYGTEQLGSATSMLEGTSFFALHETEESVLRQHLESCLREPEQVHRWEAQLRTQRGSLLWTRQTARVVAMDNGQPRLFVACEDIAEEKKQFNSIAHQANHDSMTGLVNRQHFEELLSQAIESAAHRAAVHALLFLDLDQFKLINDTAGQVVGDQVLREIACVIRGMARQRDVVARLGGDEFAVLMEHCSPEDAQRLAYATLAAIKDFRFAWEGKSMRVGVSIGLVAIDKHSGDVADILRAADIACYKAKEAGRARVEIYVESDASLGGIGDHGS